MTERDFKKLLGPAFYKVHESIKSAAHTHYWLKGGRGSGKSSFTALEVIRGMMADKEANAIALRKIGAYLRDSVYTQLLWAIEMLGAEEVWKEKLSPPELIYEPTGQKILFRGADQPDKIKSTKFKQGYCKFIWYEEADQWRGMEEIRAINQSLMRGGDRFCVFYTYNPPNSTRNWINQEITMERPDRLVHESCYLDIPEKWLGAQFYAEAAYLKEVRPEKYRHEYLGEMTGDGGMVFTNLTIRRIEDDEVALFDRIYRGLDFGYAADPLHYGECHYDAARRKLYIFFEIHHVGMKLRALAEEIFAKTGVGCVITADSSEPRSIAELKEMGVPIAGAKKGPDSVYYGIKFLQDMEEIIIDPARCPNTVREFTSYELGIDKEGNFISEFPDRNNHSIDAVRYALEAVSRNNRAVVRDIRRYDIW